MNIDGKVIVITGAARGIGQEYARYLGGLAHGSWLPTSTTARAHSIS
jgi:NAD(P)-dependent dehydrogenase (short-subunit alcohol dehydrogenase family)